MICDPSHIAGNTLLLFHVAQTALNLDMKGLMIETHINPREALSDARQQITPEELTQMLATLVYAKATTSEAGTDVLEGLRQRIDKVDRQLIEILAERMDAVKKIGEFKRDNQGTVLQMGRWNEIVNNRIWLGKSLGLQEETVKKFLDLIHIESIQLQQGIINGSSREE
jgi:chorismate mutase